MPNPAVAIVGASVLSAAASEDASRRQANAAGAAGGLVAGQSAASSAKLAPFVGSGTEANDKLTQLLGLGNPGGTNNAVYRDTYNRLFQAYDALHKSKFGVGLMDNSVDPAARDRILAGFVGQAQAAASAASNGNVPPEFGSLLKPFTGADLTSEPGYKFGLSEGEKAIDRIAGANGSRYSGATLKALSRYNEDYAGTKFDAAFNRDAAAKNQLFGMLAGVSNTGANAASGVAGIGAASANSQAELLTQAGNARAAGSVGIANAANSGLSSYMNNNMSLAYLDALKRSQPGLAAYTPPAESGVAI